MRPSAMRGGPLGSGRWSGESITRAIIVPHYGYVDKRSSVNTAAPRSDGAKSQERNLPFVKYYREEAPARVGRAVRALDRGHANFGELRHGEVRRIEVRRTSEKSTSIAVCDDIDPCKPWIDERLRSCCDKHSVLLKYATSANSVPPMKPLPFIPNMCCRKSVPLMKMGVSDARKMCPQEVQCGSYNRRASDPEVYSVPS